MRFVVPSLVGVLVFLTPFSWDGNLTIGIGIIVAGIKSSFGSYGLHIVVGILLLASALTVLGTVFKIGLIQRHKMLKELFDVPMIWMLLRITGAVFGVMYLLQIGPEILISKGVGGAVFVGIGVEVVPVYVGACLLLPLLTEFGLMEFVGTLARPLFRRVFRLPGRAAIDALASFVGAASIGLLITIGQFNQNNYTARQACVIATNFSVVAIPFAIVVASVAGIAHLFVPWYGTVFLACLVAALITPRLPPLSRKEDRYSTGALFDESSHSDGDSDVSQSLLHEAWQRAMERAAEAPGVRKYLLTSVTNIMFFLFSVLAAAMALATLATLLAFHTPVFEWLGHSVVFLLEMAKLPDASAAAPAVFAGFLDQYLPAIAASSIDSETTSFVLAGLSVCQLIFMSEVGVIILRSSLPLSFTELVMIFLLRTVIVLPVLILGAHLLTN